MMNFCTFIRKDLNLVENGSAKGISCQQILMSTGMVSGSRASQ